MPGRIVLQEHIVLSTIANALRSVTSWANACRRRQNRKIDGHFPSSPMRSALDQHPQDPHSPILPDEQLRF